MCSESSCKGIGALSPCAKRGGPSESSCKVNMSPQSSCKKSSAFRVLVQKELVLPILLLSGAFESSCKTNLCPPSSCKKGSALNPRAKEWVLPTLVQSAAFRILVQNHPCPPSSCKKAAFRTLVQNEPPILVQRGRCLQNPRAKRAPLCQKELHPRNPRAKPIGAPPNPRAKPISAPQIFMQNSSVPPKSSCKTY